MKKYLLDFKVKEVKRYDGGTALLELEPAGGELPEMLPGQFINVEVKDCDGVFLRRPISICDVNHAKNTLSLYIKRVGKGTNHLCNSNVGDIFNLLLPLGNGFATGDKELPKHPLLVGGGVGMAPMLYLGKYLKDKGVEPQFLLGGAGREDIPLLDMFIEAGKTYLTTADGSLGTKGFVTDHEIIKSDVFDKVYCCGPTPMMKAVGSICINKGVACEVSLENRMACGLGACLCCVENTSEGHKCVCTDGPVFDIKDLKW